MDTQDDSQQCTAADCDRAPYAQCTDCDDPYCAEHTVLTVDDMHFCAECRPDVRGRRIAAGAMLKEQVTGALDGDTVTDLLAALLHWCDACEVSFGDALSSAYRHYHFERNPRALGPNDLPTAGR